ncbi:hypothetical protein GCM10007938_10660 [Vibrio zhanjiangensis]|uniref:Uncharacterized protein n=1 Tax=Vibrio zhanjiangensis TaxID=1046128 RepID=A0ABQ6EWD1_9VIBR|nr:hypothetical protein [Vibrio zhanjiangensis]GLT17289.1 hypothetical protein GCM10007938_10660 [Vibrio zhanjiangensis]
MTYQQLDAIADLYIPLLGILTLVWLLIKASRLGIKSALIEAVTTSLGVMYIYALMFLDAYFAAYASIGLDYSTHTALALVFVTTLALISKEVRRITVISMLCYCLLMLYQGYHTLADMALTSLMTLPVLVWLKSLPNRKDKRLW